MLSELNYTEEVFLLGHTRCERVQCHWGNTSLKRDWLRSKVAMTTLNVNGFYVHGTSALGRRVMGANPSVTRIRLCQIRPHP